MSKAIKISTHLANTAMLRAKVMNRSMAGQIEYWARIGQIAEDNPDLSYSLIKNILISMTEAEAGQLEEYTFDEGKMA